jgi:hypothetical protein
MIIDKFLDKLSTREKAGLLIALLSLLALVVDWRVIAPIYRQSKQLDAQIMDVRKELLLNRAIIGRGIPPDYATISASVEQTASQDEVAREMKDEISDLAKKNGVDLPSVEDREATGVISFGKELAVEIVKIETDIGTLTRFMDALQKSRGMLRVSRLSLTPGKERNRVKGSMLITKLMIPVAQPSAETKSK